MTTATPTRLPRSATTSSPPTVVRPKSISGTCKFSSNSEQNPFDSKSQKSLSIQDIPHTFVTSFLYELPFGKGKAFLSSPAASPSNSLPCGSFGRRRTPLSAVFFAHADPFLLRTSAVPSKLYSGAATVCVSFLQENWLAPPFPRPLPRENGPGVCRCRRLRCRLTAGGACNDLLSRTNRKPMRRPRRGHRRRSSPSPAGGRSGGSRVPRTGTGFPSGRSGVAHRSGGAGL